MKISHRTVQSNQILVFIFRLIIPVLILIGGLTPGVHAQTSTGRWETPVNLSQSGATSNPQFVVDSEGIFHVLWVDAYSDFGYISGDGIEWNDPVPAKGPYGEFPPEIFPDADGFIHAFWSDADGLFYTSKARAAEFSQMSGWLGKSQLGSFVTDVDATVDSEGRMHLVYIRAADTEGQPAGVYYQSMDRMSTSWSLPMLLYQSDYMRSATPDTSSLEIVSSTTEDGVHLYVVWDNRARERVYLSRSIDGGGLWSPPEEIDKPQEGALESGALNIRVGATGNEVLLLWQSGKTETSCQQYYQFSNDGGNTWEPSQRMFEGFQICPDDVQIFQGESGPILLLTGIQTYLQAWDGSRWSDPQLQDTLTTFVDPETQNLVQFGCQQGELIDKVNLFVVGCDSGTGGDTWMLARPLVDIAEWFPQEAVWNPLVSLSSSEGRLRSPKLVADERGRLHAFWSQSDSANPNGPGKGIQYARWEGGQWSQPEMVLLSPDGRTDQPDAAISADNRLFAVWSGGDGGQIYFSQANADQAVLAESWDSPQRLPSLQATGSAPRILIDRAGVMSVVYAIPLNENRGIYLVQSGDGGQTWSEPNKIFDAVAAGWAMVDWPHLAITDNGNMHVLWTRYSLPNGEGPLALYYARSEDNGATWSTPQTVVEKAVGWSQLAGIGQNTVHRVWQEGSGGNTTLWHEQSLDGGISWQRTAPVSVFGETAGLPSLIWDSSGQLQLLQVVKSGLNQYVLQHWRFDGARWSAERSLNLDFSMPTTVSSNVSGITESGDLGVLFSVVSGDLVVSDTQGQILFANRMLGDSMESGTQENLPPSSATLEVEPTSVETLTPTTVPTDVAILEPTPVPPEAIATITEAPTVIPDGPAPARNSWLTSIVLPVIVGMIVLAIAVVSFRVIRNRQDKNSL